MVGEWIDLNFCWCISRLQYFLWEYLSKLLHLDDSKLLTLNTDNAFEALCRWEGVGLFQALILKWGDLILVVTTVAKIWSWAEGKDSILALNDDFAEGDFAGA